MTQKEYHMETQSTPRGIPDGGFDEIHIATRKRDVEKVKDLVASGIDVDLRNRIEYNGDGGNTPLWFAAQGPGPNCEAVAKVLIDAGADVNAICEHGTTAMHLACSWGHEDLAALIGSSGADLGIKDGDGMTPEVVARNGYPWQLTEVSDYQRAGVIRYFDSRIER